MFGLWITAAVLNFIMIFLIPVAVSSRPPQLIKSWVGATSNGTHVTPAGLLPHRRCSFLMLRSFPFLILSFFTALITIVASAVATVMFIIFANAFVNADPNLNIEARVGKQMFAFMWVASAFSLIPFIIQLGSCCAACCGGRNARRKLQAEGVDLRKKHVTYSTGPATPAESHAVSTEQLDVR